MAVYMTLTCHHRVAVAGKAPKVSLRGRFEIQFEGVRVANDEAASQICTKVG
jgi:hypothetical protein